MESKHLELLIRIDERLTKVIEEIDTLRKDQDTQNSRQQIHEKKVDTLLSQATGAGFVLAAIGGALLWLLDKVIFKFFT